MPPSYAPYSAHAGLVTFRAVGRISAGDPVEIAGPWEVRRPTVAAAPYIGIAAHECDPTVSDRVGVFVNGTVHEGACSGPVAPGDLLIAGFTAGAQVMAVPTPTAPINPADILMERAVIGKALTGGSDGQVVRWLAFR